MSTTFENILKLVFLGILIIIYIVYLYLKKHAKKEVAEGFQNTSSDLSTDFFDLSANYNGLLESELPPIPKDIVFNEPPPILNIGSSLGTMDPANMPWDSENKELKQSEALWGIPPSQATTALFRKVYISEQAQDVGALPYNEETQQVKFNSPTFNYGTQNPEEGAAFAAADAILPMAIENMGGVDFLPPGPLEAAREVKRAEEAAESLKKAATEAAEDLATATKNLQGKVGAELAQAADDVKRAQKLVNSIAADTQKTIKALAKNQKILNNLGEAAAAKYLAQAADGTTELVAALRSMNANKLADFVTTMGAKIESVTSGIKGLLKFKSVGKLTSAAGGVKAAIKAQLLAAKTSFQGTKFAAKVGLGFQKSLTKTVTKVVAKGFGTFIAAITSFKLLITLGNFIGNAPPVGLGIQPTGGLMVIAGILLDNIYMFLVMPLLLILTLPDGPITKAMEKLSDPAGCCPEGSVPMDQVVPEGVNMFLGLIPIVGDIIGILHPYVCVPPLGKVGPPLLRFTLVLPKYIRDEPALTTQWIDWPEYNCSSGPAVVLGKVVGSVPARGTNGIIPTPITYNWNQGGFNYTNLAEIVRNPNNYAQVTKIMKGFEATYQTQYIGKPDMKMYFSDFSEPTALVEMAQFYYNNAILNQLSNSDATVSISYISKINYVVASSLFSCDVMCEMINATFDPVDGSGYTEITTYNHDRRFYYTSPNVADNPNAAYWGTTTDEEWKRRDDEVDSTLYILNDYITNKDYFNNNYLNGKVLVTVYQNKTDTKQQYDYARITESPDLGGFKLNYDIADSNYSELLLSIVKTGQNFTTLSNNVTYLIKNNLEAQSNLYAHHVLSRPYNPADPLKYNNPTYVLRGCTFLDSTAAGATPPDPSNLEFETRARVNFDVTRFLNRGSRIHINTLFCAAKDNITDVITAYSNQYPQKRIKTIKNIKGFGKNACRFTWDEVTLDSSMRESAYSNVVNNILYQQDLSSCRFALPNTSNNIPNVDGKKTLYGATVAGVSSDTLPLPPVAVKLYPLTLGANVNSNLQYLQAAYYNFVSNATPENTLFNPPIPGGNPIFVWTSNVDIIPRYNPQNYSNILPELIRPKKPIRVKYPVGVEVERLGGLSNNYCGTTQNMENFILDYNTNSNTKDKILKIVRAYTTSSNICDYEVDMIISSNSTQFLNNTGKSILQRRTLSYVMKPEGFQNYTYSNIANYDGLNIQSKNPMLNPPYSDGYYFANPYLNNLRKDLVSNVTYFNDELIKTFTSQTNSMKKATNLMLYGLVGTQYLGDGTGKKRCNDPEIMQRILEKYNSDNYPLGRLSQTQNIMYSIFQSSTSDSNTCHLYFANSNHFYTDFYAVNPKDSNNYIGNLGTPILKSIKMVQLSPTLFAPDDVQTYPDIPANDVAILSDLLLSNFYTSVRPDNTCTPVNCLDPLLYNAAINDYTSQTGNTISGITSTLPIGNNTCDYRVITTINDSSLASEPIPDIDAILRVKYRAQPYSRTEPTCSYTYKRSVFDTNTYTSDSLQLQFAANIDLEDPNLSPLLTMNTGLANTLDSKILRTPINFN